MIITATQFKANIGHYLDSVINDDVYITKNGKIAALLSDPRKEKKSLLDSIAGICAANPVSLEEIKMERILRRAYPGEDPYTVKRRFETMAVSDQSMPYQYGDSGDAKTQE